jgi:hypothetical protein
MGEEHGQEEGGESFHGGNGECVSNVPAPVLRATTFDLRQDFDAG